jgi:hypothetical protein
MKSQLFLDNNLADVYYKSIKNKELRFMHTIFDQLIFCRLVIEQSSIIVEFDIEPESGLPAIDNPQAKQLFGPLRLMPSAR